MLQINKILKWHFYYSTLHSGLRAQIKFLNMHTVPVKKAKTQIKKSSSSVSIHFPCRQTSLTRAGRLFGHTNHLPGLAWFLNQQKTRVLVNKKTSKTILLLGKMTTLHMQERCVCSLKKNMNSSFLHIIFIPISITLFKCKHQY